MLTIYTSEIENSQCHLRTTLQGNQIVELRIHELVWNTVVFDQNITFTTSYGPHLTSIVPSQLYLSLNTDNYIQLLGSGFTTEC